MGTPHSLDPAALAHRAVRQALDERGRTRGGSTRRAGVHADWSGAAGPDRPGAGGAAAPPAARAGPELVTAECLAETAEGGTLHVPTGATVTPLAQEEAWRRSIRLARGTEAHPGSGTALRVAVASDHGGFRMKEALLEWVRELGHTAFDLGCPDEAAVDYPDLAAAVARAVAGGDAEAGICVDGAGIGSAMAANKIAGVRAANCWSVAAAKNAREHNYANVLTLGGRMLSDGEAVAIVRAFLATPWGAERHGRRVAKISALEARPERA